MATKELGSVAGSTREFPVKGRNTMFRVIFHVEQAWETGLKATIFLGFGNGNR